MKKILLLSLLPLYLALCSFSSSALDSEGLKTNNIDLNKYAKSNVITSTTKNSGLGVGQTVEIDLGRRNGGIIGQYLNLIT